MSDSNTPKKPCPTMPERYGQYLELSQLNAEIAKLELAYEQTQNELVYSVLQGLIRFKEKSRKNFFKLEDLYRDEELQEFFKNPGKYPFAVRIWMLHYREDEIS